MKRKGIFLLLLISMLILILSLGGATSAQSEEPQLKMVTIEAKNYGQVRRLAAMGIDIASVQEGDVKIGPRGFTMQSYVVEAVVSAFDEKELGNEGFSWSDVPGKGPAHKIGTPYEVYKSFDEPVTGIRAQLRRVHATYPKLTQIKTIGHSIQKRHRRRCYVRCGHFEARSGNDCHRRCGGHRRRIRDGHPPGGRDGWC